MATAMGETLVGLSTSVEIVTVGASVGAVQKPENLGSIEFSSASMIRSSISMMYKVSPRSTVRFPSSSSERVRVIWSPASLMAALNGTFSQSSISSSLIKKEIRLATFSSVMPPSSSIVMGSEKAIIRSVSTAILPLKCSGVNVTSGGSKSPVVKANTSASSMPA